jgi:hypothetical protein
VIGLDLNGALALRALIGAVMGLAALLVLLWALAGMTKGWP